MKYSYLIRVVDTLLAPQSSWISGVNALPVTAQI
jgi:hypothetical protein